MKYIKQYEYNIDKIENNVWSDLNQKDTNDKFKLYGEYIINLYFKEEDIADIKIEIYSLTFYLNVEFFTMNLNPKHILLISKFCEYINTIGRYKIYVKESEGDDSLFGIECQIDKIDDIKKLIMAKKYNVI